MLRPLLACSLWLTLALSADHDTFKDCGRVPFCSNLRNRGPANVYSVDRGSADTSQPNSVQLTMPSNDGSPTLTLTIQAIEGSTFRVKIKPAGSDPYELRDVLDGEPTTAGIDTYVGDSDITVSSGDDRLVVNLEPFGIRAYKGEVLEQEIDGNRLIFDGEAFALGVTFHQASNAYGIHEHADHLALKSTVNNGDPYRLKNSDVAYYELYSQMALYGAIPVIYGHGAQFTSGIFLQNAAEQFHDINKNGDDIEAYIMAESGALDLFILLGPSIVEVVRQYVKLTGTAHLPQLWALGYHQSRWNYNSQDDVKDVVTQFNNNNFPLDAIWLDIEYTDNKKYFTWDQNTFSNPTEMQDYISNTNKKLVTIIDPHIKIEGGYNVYDGALDGHFFVMNSDGSVFAGQCWPGWSSYIDFLNPDARTYYARYYHYDNFPGSTPTLGGIWNDMNEPSVFDNGLEMTLPVDSVHYGGVQHHVIHNIYGLLHSMSTHQGLMERDNGQLRPFVLTRSTFAGSQRYAAVWTGDNTADWGYLSIAYSMCLNSNILGLVFCGADVGGFFYDPPVELLERWYQAGAWLPFYRAHAHIDTQRREPYLFDQPVQEVLRNAMELRYKHLPVWYTLFYEHTRTGDPIIRPLFYHYPQDVNTYEIENQLLVGRDILVRAVTDPGVGSVQVYFPGGQDELWMSINDESVHAGSGAADIPVDIQAIPVYYRRGAVIVRKDDTKLSTADMANDGHSLHVLLDGAGNAQGTVYLDDNASFEYLNNARYNYLRIDADATHVTLSNIGDFNNDGFEFLINEVIVHTVQRMPENGVPGSYTKVVYSTDVHGVSLKRFKMARNATSATFQFAW